MKMPALLLCLTLLAGASSTEAAQYQVGEVVTNFTIYARREWTDSSGKTFAPGAPMRLSDFAGKVIFVEFFDPT